METGEAYFGGSRLILSGSDGNRTKRPSKQKRLRFKTVTGEKHKF